MKDIKDIKDIIDLKTMKDMKDTRVIKDMNNIEDMTDRKHIKDPEVQVKKTQNSQTVGLGFLRWVSLPNLGLRFPLVKASKGWPLALTAGLGFHGLAPYPNRGLASRPNRGFRLLRVGPSP